MTQPPPGQEPAGTSLFGLTKDLFPDLAPFAKRDSQARSRPWPWRDGSALAKARWLYAARRHRPFREADLLGEPGWDMLLDMFIHGEEGRQISVSSVTLAADVPSTTALRWLHKMELQGIVVRTDDVRDGRRAFVALSEEAMATMRRYLAALS